MPRETPGDNFVRAIERRGGRGPKVMIDTDAGREGPRSRV